MTTIKFPSDAHGIFLRAARETPRTADEPRVLVRIHRIRQVELVSTAEADGAQSIDVSVGTASIVAPQMRNAQLALGLATAHFEGLLEGIARSLFVAEQHGAMRGWADEQRYRAACADIDECLEAAGTLLREASMDRRYACD